MSTLQKLETAAAPAAIGPYSQGISFEQLIFISGQIPLDPQTKQMPEDIKAQTTLALNNVKAVLEAAGSELGKVVKVTVFLTDMNDFAAANEVYSTFFTAPYPARSCVAVKALPRDAKVEVEVIATH